MRKRTEDSGTDAAPTEADSTGREVPPDFFPDLPSREAIMQLLRAHGKAMTFRALAKDLGAEEAMDTGLQRRLQAMARDGQVQVSAQGRVSLNRQSAFIAGRVLGHRDGFGFLQRDDGGPDLFLSPREMLKVLHGDRVMVRPDGEYRGRPEGVIVEVIERRTNRLVGRFLKERGIYVVVPEDQRIKHDIVVPPADTQGASQGQVVVAEIVSQPTRQSPPLARVVEVLGEIDDPGMEIEIAVRKFDVPHVFSEQALNQAARIPQRVRRTEYAGRQDLRDVPFVTIDGEDARDFDDAVYCEAIDLGTASRRRPAWRLLVAIADVSHYVRPNDAMDAEAQSRGTSVYFPRRVIPMLPEALSNGICSLNPAVERLAVVCDMVIAASGARAGQVTAYQFYEAVIQSRARCTYDDVWSALQQPGGPAAQQMEAVLPHLRDLHALYQLLAQARQARGAIDFDTVETRIVCNPLGRIERIEPMVRNDAHKLIEECMLAANTCAADFMTRNKRQGLYRVHEGPTPERLLALREYLRTLGLSLEGGDDPSTQDYMNLLQAARARPDHAIIQTMCLRSMQQAIYSPEQSGHFGLAYERYAHFTSPIRRYPDLLVHRVIKSVLRGERYVPEIEGMLIDPTLPAKERERDTWEQLGVMLSATERRADDASRDVAAWLKCWYMKERIGEEFSGRVTGVAPFGLFVTLDTLYVEGMVHVSELGSEYIQYNEALHELRGERTGIRYRLTDTLQVQVSRVDLEARRIDFRLVKPTGFKALQATADGPAKTPRVKRAAAPKPASLVGTSKERRAQERRQAKQQASSAQASKSKAAKSRRK